MIRACLTLALALSSLSFAMGDDRPLHQQIDELVGFGSVPLCTDAEFLRRASLDLTGRPPAVEEVRKFLADTSPDKRSTLVDHLLESPHHLRHFTTFLDVMLMERRAIKHVSQDEWTAWLYQSVRENKPWNVLAREILAADGDQPEKRAAVRFYLDRDAEPNLLTRDVSRIFFGRDIQCAQCHDHPSVRDYLQSDYQGLLALLSPGYIVAVKKGEASVSVYGERAGSDIQFESVFIKGTPHRTGARVPGNSVLDEPFFLPGDEYEVAVADGVKAVPKFSRRKQLAELATNGQNRLFNENIANRLWAMMFGQGLFQPVDMNHPANPPLNPALLALLSERLVAQNYDMRAFLKELALTQTYQRPFETPADFNAEATIAKAELEQLQTRRDAIQQACDAAQQKFEQAEETWFTAEKSMLPAVAALDTACAGCADARKKMNEVQTTLTTASTQLTAKQTVLPAVKAAADAATQAIAQLPNDAELVAAAQKFNERNQQLTKEVGDLQKVVDENTSKMPELTTTFETTRQNVETSKPSAEQLRADWKTKEQDVLAARSALTKETTQLEAINKQLVTTKRLTELSELTAATAADQQQISEKSAALAAAQQQVSEMAPQMATQTLELQAANEAVNAAVQTLNLAKGNLAVLQEQSQAVLAAMQSTEAARAKIPDDLVLTETVQKLKERVDAFQSQMQGPQQGVTNAEQAVTAAQAKVAAVQKSLQDGQAEMTRRETALKETQSQLKATQDRLVSAEKTLNSTRQAVTDRLCSAGRLAALKPLSPEQMCWSIFQVTGVYDRYRATEAAALEQSAPLTAEQKLDPVQVRNREIEIEQKTYEKLKGNMPVFVQYFGAAAGEPQGDFFATVDQALFARNGGELNSWVAPVEGNAADRALKSEDPAKAAEELYLAVLSRTPTAEESALIASHLQPRAADRELAVREIVWGLLTSAEFRFNH